MKSLDLIYPKPGHVELSEQELPAPGEGEVLCRTTRSLVSIGTEMTCLRGEFDPDTNWHEWVRYPFRPGYSISAVVCEAGRGVKGLRQGDRVSVSETHRQYFTAAEGSLIKLSDKITDEQAAWVALGRVAQNTARRCQIQIGERVAVIGAGQVGQLVAGFVRQCGATRVIAVDPVKRRAEMALQSGATHAFAVRADEALESVLGVTGPDGADVVIDTTGHPSVLAAACKLARTNGRLGLVGDCPSPSRQFLGPGVVNRYLTILGAHGFMTAAQDNPFYPWTERRTNEITIDYIESGRLCVDHLVTRRCSPREAPQVYLALLRGQTAEMGVIIDWDGL